MEWAVSLLAGVGLAAATGFRVFVPLLGMSLAAKAGILSLSPGFDWLSSPVALGALAIATVLEVGTYFVPWLDNAMDTIATPAAIGAGTVAALSVLGDGSPFLAWVLAIIAGGGTAGVVHAGTVGARFVSTATTGGAANPALALGELIASVSMTVISILLPVVAGAVVVALLAWAFRRIRAWRARRAPGEAPPLGT
ncbi:MAG: DUF4126 domain-containing protein [Gemmatimonadota bacterium]